MISTAKPWVGRVEKGVLGFKGRSFLSYASVRLSWIKSSSKSQNCSASSTDGWRRLCCLCLNVFNHWISLRFKVQKCFPDAGKKPPKPMCFVKTVILKLNSYEYLRTSYPISKARKTPLWTALEESTNTQRWTTELSCLNLHFLILSEIKWNPKWNPLCSITWSFMACDMYKLKQTMLTAQLFNLFIWAWKLHKANISIISQELWLQAHSQTPWKRLPQRSCQLQENNA